ncbi:MAG: helix-turn-helix transcriptional regulator [Clostridia bacterium]|nr:helix-turn-helix transcriptional regulator [Clostridia bacterium]
MGVLSLREDGSEILTYNAPDYPISTDYSCLSIFPGYAANCHWHQDFESLITLDCDLDYSVNGQCVHLHPGDAIFVNSRRLHYGYSPSMTEGHYCFAVFHPELMGIIPAVASALEKLEEDGSPGYWLLSAQKEEDRPMIETIRFLCDHATPREALAVVSACASLLNAIMKRYQEETSQTSGADWAIVRRMVGYIQGHYQEKLMLEDIAAAGAVCRSKCCKLFREKLHITPQQYVMRYRLGKACDLIRDGASITDAAFDCGFQGLSYFSEAFKKQYGISPSVYHRRIRENET